MVSLHMLHFLLYIYTTAKGGDILAATLGQNDPGSFNYDESLTDPFTSIDDLL